MGIDLVSIKNETTEGATNSYEEYKELNKDSYFRANWWWWRAMWDYCALLKYEDGVTILSEEDHNKGHYNDGWIIDEDTAGQLGEALHIQIETGASKEYEASRQEFIEENPEKEEKHYHMDDEFLGKFADFCLVSGGFAIH